MLTTLTRSSAVFGVATGVAVGVTVGVVLGVAVGVAVGVVLGVAVGVMLAVGVGLVSASICRFISRARSHNTTASARVTLSFGRSVPSS